jgi:hypothetical protein
MVNMGNTVTQIRSPLVACPEGIEPPTTCLEGRCSIQLSYGQICGLREA